MWKCSIKWKRKQEIPTMDYANALDSWWKASQLLDVYGCVCVYMFELNADIAKKKKKYQKTKSWRSFSYLDAFDFPLYTWQMLNVCIIFGLFSCSRFNCHLCVRHEMYLCLWKFHKMMYTYVKSSWMRWKSDKTIDFVALVGTKGTDPNAINFPSNLLSFEWTLGAPTQ